jgi:transposase
MRPKGTGEALEIRRRAALRMLDEGQTEEEVCEVVGCSRSSLFRWKQAREVAGDEGLVTKESPGRPCKLSDEQVEKLRTILEGGALKRGFSSELWTSRRVVMVIEEEFGISYHPDHIGRLLHRIAFSPQLPIRRAVERNEEEIAAWWAHDWPALKKKQSKRAPALRSSTRRGFS